MCFLKCGIFRNQKNIIYLFIYGGRKCEHDRRKQIEQPISQNTQSDNIATNFDFKRFPGSLFKIPPPHNNHQIKYPDI